LTREKTAISDKWIKASIIGTIWAAAEIVLGSFLHNLRVPFSGNMLTAIALVILIAVSYRWREKGRLLEGRTDMCAHEGHVAQRNHLRTDDCNNRRIDPS